MTPTTRNIVIAVVIAAALLLAFFAFKKPETQIDPITGLPVTPPGTVPPPDTLPVPMPGSTPTNIGVATENPSPPIGVGIAVVNGMCPAGYKVGLGGQCKKDNTPYAPAQGYYTV